MDAAFYGLTTIMDLRVLGYEYCTRNHIPHPLNRETKMAGKNFYEWIFETEQRFISANYPIHSIGKQKWQEKILWVDF